MSDDIFTAQEKRYDYYNKVNRSDISLDSEEASADLGFSGFILKKLYADIVFVEFVDIEDGFTENDGLLVQSKLTSNWRKGVVRMVSPWVEENGTTRVGDIVVFPNSKGLPSGTIKYIGGDGKISVAKNAIFLTEQKIFATVEPDNIP